MNCEVNDVGADSKAPEAGSLSSLTSTDMSYDEFLVRNPGIGYLKIQASRARQAIPTPAVRILITQDFQNMRVLFFDGQTDADGLIEGIPLPAPPKDGSLDAHNFVPGAVYQVYANHPQFEPQRYQVEIFENITVILPVTLPLPKEE